MSLLTREKLSAKEIKKEKIAKIKDKAEVSKSIIFYDFHRVDNESIFQLKKKLKNVGADWRVYKNNLVKKVLGENLDLKWANSLIFCQDEHKPLKVLSEFDQDFFGKSKINGGWYEKNFVQATTLEEWAKLPTKEESLQLFCHYLTAHLSNLVKFLEQLAEKKSKSE